MYLIGDIGNTEIKICLVNLRYKIVKKIILKTDLITKIHLYKKLKFITKNIILKKVLFCSVVPKKFKIIKNYIESKKNIKVKELKQIDLKNRINILVNKKQIGSDRVSNALAVADKNKNYILIDFGTATTFDVVKKKNYLGGVIAPGVILSLLNLTNKASLIPKIKMTKSKKILGKNTSEAVKSGFYWGYIGLINNIIKQIILKTKTNYKIIITGGLAHIFKNSLNYKTEIDKELTLKGIIKLL